MTMMRASSTTRKRACRSRTPVRNERAEEEGGEDGEEVDAEGETDGVGAGFTEGETDELRAKSRKRGGGANGQLEERENLEDKR